MKTTKYQHQLAVSAHTAERLAHYALQCGYRVSRGPSAGQGSRFAFLEALVTATADPAGAARAALTEVLATAPPVVLGVGAEKYEATIYVSDAIAEGLTALAVAAGFLVDRGPEAGTGSRYALLASLVAALDADPDAAARLCRLLQA